LSIASERTSDVFYYRHGDGDDVIEPGELYGIMRTETPVFDPNLGQTGDDSSRGRFVDSLDCCVDADCRQYIANIPWIPEGMGASQVPGSSSSCVPWSNP
jgi:hypothetical protein